MTRNLGPPPGPQGEPTQSKVSENTSDTTAHVSASGGPAEHQRMVFPYERKVAPLNIFEPLRNNLNPSGSVMSAGLPPRFKMGECPSAERNKSPPLYIFDDGCEILARRGCPRGAGPPRGLHVRDLGSWHVYFR